MEKSQSLSEDKLELINWISNLSNVGIIDNIKFIKNNYTNDDWYNLHGILSKYANEDLRKLEKGAWENATVNEKA